CSYLVYVCVCVCVCVSVVVVGVGVLFCVVFFGVCGGRRLVLGCVVVWCCRCGCVLVCRGVCRCVCVSSSPRWSGIRALRLLSGFGEEPLSTPTLPHGAPPLALALPRHATPRHATPRHST